MCVFERKFLLSRLFCYSSAIKVILISLFLRRYYVKKLVFGLLRLLPTRAKTSQQNIFLFFRSKWNTRNYDEKDKTSFLFFFHFFLRFFFVTHVHAMLLCLSIDSLLLHHSLSVCLSVSVFLYLSVNVYVSVRLSFCLSMFLSVYLYLYRSLFPIWLTFLVALLSFFLSIVGSLWSLFPYISFLILPYTSSHF